MYPLLKGLRIVEITTIILGPYATQILGDLGAEIIKVETLDGDMNRYTPPLAGPGLGAGFVNNNRNKRSLAVDLKSAAGKEVLRRLIATADALVHNMRQPALDRLGFSWEAVHALNPRLVYCAALGYGSNGPYAGKPAYDDIIQATSGLAGLNARRDGEPTYHPTVTADKVSALHVVYGVLAALLHRERTGGLGQKIEMPMLEAMAAFTMNEHLMAATFEEAGTTGYHRTLSRNRRPFKTRDGHIALLPYTTEQWRRVLIEIGRTDIVAEPWFESNSERSKRSDALYGVLGEALVSRTSRDWLDVFERIDVPCGPLNTIDSVLADPHLVAAGVFEPNYATATPMRRALRQPLMPSAAPRLPDTAPPALGADTRAILAEIGYADDDIAALVAEKAVGAGEPSG